MSPKTKILVAKTIAAILGVLILIVVGLMIYLSIAKLRSDSSEQAAASEASAAPSKAIVAQAVSSLNLGPLCSLADIQVSSNRIVLYIGGDDISCDELIILQSSSGELVNRIKLRD